MEIGSNANINLRQKFEQFNDDNNVIEWNAYISHKLFTKKNGDIKLQVYDILDQKTGFQRSFSSNAIVERNYEVLKRYFLLSFTWNFTKNPATK